MNSKKRILVLTLSFGAGHIRAAESVFMELRRQLPEADLLLVDALQHCSFPFRALYVWTYWAMIRYAPSLWNKFFNARRKRRDEQTAPAWLWRNGCKNVFETIQNFQPEMIVACEVGACEIAVIARRTKLTEAKIINIITDFEAEPIWVKPEISGFAVPNKEVAEQLQKWGADAERIKICGIPLDESFSRTQDTQKVKVHFALDERQIVLLMGGGMGPTRMDFVASRLLERGENLNIIALFGKDKRMGRKLDKLKDSATVSLNVIGWTDRVAALMQSAAVLATKPGGVTLSEAAVCGLPIVFFDAIPGPEVSNAARFVDAGAGSQTTGSEETAVEILRLVNDKNALSAMVDHCRKLAHPKAAVDIVRLVLAELQNPHVIGEYLSTEKSNIPSFWSKLNLRKRPVVEVEVK